MKNKKLTREEALRRYRSTRDRKEKRLEEMKELLFKRYIERTGEEPKSFLHYDQSLIDEDGIMNAATLFIRNDNPLLPKIISEFNETAMLLRQKPD